MNQNFKLCCEYLCFCHYSVTFLFIPVYVKKIFFTHFGFIYLRLNNEYVECISLYIYYQLVGLCWFLK